MKNSSSAIKSQGAEHRHVRATPSSVRSAIVTGEVEHLRLQPLKHGFKYPCYWYVFELNEIQELFKHSLLLGYNRWRLSSIFDRDYLTEGNQPIKDKLLKYLNKHGYLGGVDGAPELELGEIYLVTSCRYLGHVFNPVSFYFCYNTEGDLAIVVAEINNTFEERHCYILDARVSQSGEPTGGSDEISQANERGLKKSSRARQVHGHYIFEATKQFHVSPFFKRQGTYKFRFADIRERLDIAIDLVDDSGKLFTSRMSGPLVPYSSSHHASVVLRFPLNALLTIPRIYWQAIQLFFRRRLPVIPKPNVASVHTIRAKPYSWFDQFAISLLRKRLKMLSGAQLRVIFPDGEVEEFGDNSVNERATIQLRNFEIFRKLVLRGGLAFGESYVAGDWDSPDLAALLRLILNQWSAFDERKLQVVYPIRAWQFFKHLLRSNSISKSRKNIGAHYDLGNQLFKTFLDPSLTYSSAVFKSAETSLEDAQTEKINRILDAARVGSGQHLLEIGSGWGALAIAAAKRGAKVTSITLSTEQLEYAKQRAANEGLSEQIEFKLIDYRHMTGKFDAIVSVEMIEAVGERYLPEYFNAFDRLLKPDGIAVIQAIVFPQPYYQAYRKRADWIQEYIFPGSHLPSFKAIVDSISKGSGLVVEAVSNYSLDYARTLAEWRLAFHKSSAELSGLGYDEKFQRTWDFYLASCEAEFATRWLQVMQITISHPNNQRLVSEDAQRVGY